MIEKTKNKKSPIASENEEERFYCSVCGREISEDEYDNYDGMCWECWDDQMTEESEDLFGDVM